LTVADFLFLKYTGIAPGLKNTWWFALLISLLAGAGITLGCGGASLTKRFMSAAAWGILTGVLYTLASAYFLQETSIVLDKLTINAAWHMFIFTLFSTIAAVVTELRLPDPHLK
jgi:hypothetical protein